MPDALAAQKTVQRKAAVPARGAPAALLIRLLLLAIPFALFLALFEVRFARFTPSDVQAKRVLLERRLSRTQVLIMGSSHEFAGILPAELSLPAFDLAGQSQSLYYDVALVRKYLSAMPSLKLVILPISYFSFGYELDECAESWRTYQYAYVYSIPHRDWHKTISARNFSAYFLSSESFRAKVTLGRATNAMLDFDAYGGWTNRPSGKLLPANADTNYLYQAAMVALQRHEAMMNPKNVPANLARVEKLITELRRRGVDVLLITLPVTRFYGEHIQAATYREMQEALRHLTEKYHLRYLNYMFDSRFKDADFADGDHLNYRGARKMTRFLNEELPQAGRIGPAPAQAQARP